MGQLAGIMECYKNLTQILLTLCRRRNGGEEVLNGSGDRLRLFYGADVSGIWNNHQPGTGDSIRDSPRLGNRCGDIPFSRNHQRRRCDF